MATYIGALDLGTTSNRFILFDPQGRMVGADQMEHAQIFPKPGWVEHDPMEIWENTCKVIKGALGKVGVSGREIMAIGITNQRETAVVWDRQTGKPLYNAIVWQCTRTDAICRELARDGGQDRFRQKTGLPIATYFAGPKIKWILEKRTGGARSGGPGPGPFRDRRDLDHLAADRRRVRRCPCDRCVQCLPDPAHGSCDAVLG
nr:FGGY family carbohydrate kinase [Desulfosarcina cetonica]